MVFDQNEILNFWNRKMILIVFVENDLPNKVAVERFSKFWGLMGQKRVWKKKREIFQWGEVLKLL